MSTPNNTEEAKDALSELFEVAYPRLLAQRFTDDEGNDAGGMREGHAVAAIYLTMSIAQDLGWTPPRVQSVAERDVLAEREKQIAKGYTPEHDDDHSLKRILHYGGLDWHFPFYDRAEAATSRTRLVRMAACIIAAIEWLDRRTEGGS